MKNIYENDSASPRVPVIADTTPDAEQVEQIRRDIERMTGRPMATRTEPKEDGQV